MVTEAEESATSKARALANLRDQVAKGETYGVVQMYEDAAYRAGASCTEVKAALKQPRPETNDEGLTWPEWAAAAGCGPAVTGTLRDEWRTGVDPTEYRANPAKRDLLLGDHSLCDPRDCEGDRG